MIRNDDRPLNVVRPRSLHAAAAAAAADVDRDVRPIDRSRSHTYAGIQERQRVSSPVRFAMTLQSAATVVAPGVRVATGRRTASTERGCATDLKADGTWRTNLRGSRIGTALPVNQTTGVGWEATIIAA